MSNDAYQKMEDLYEPIIAAYKSELTELDIFDKISEGQDLYNEGTLEVWVVPGRDRIESRTMHMLEHFLELNIIIMTSAEDTLPPDLREIGHKAFDALMADITHGGTCKWALPTLFHPGYMQIADILTVGILIQHLCRFTQFYNLPPS